MKLDRAATLKEIAQRAGVGKAAASVVLNGARSGTRVSEQTRQAILDAAKELNYRPNAMARSLRKRRTGIVGYFSGYQAIDPHNQYVSEIMGGLQAGCVGRGLDLLLYTPHEGLTPERIVATLSDGRMDGLVVTARPEHPLSSMLIDSTLPVVAISDLIPGLPSIVVDGVQGGRLQAQHLFERGHRRVLYMPADFPFPSVQQRFASFCEEAKALTLEVVVGSPIHGHHPDIGLQANLLDRWMSPDDLAHLRGPNRATAVLCWDDAPAHRVASQLAGLGIRVPQDVAVMGFNGCVPGTELRWNLSTIRAPWREVAKTAIDTLYSYMEGLDVPQVQTLPVELVLGATT